MTESSGIRVALINPPVRTNDAPRFIPYGLGILANVINELGHDVAISDCNAERVDHETLRKIFTADVEVDKRAFDVFGLGGIITTYGWQKEIIPLLRKDHPSSLIIAGGGCASSLQENMLRWIPELDIVCVGEGEKTFPEVLEHVWDRDFSNVKGIVYRDKDNIVANERRPLMTEKELNELPYPLWVQLPMEEVYFRNSPIMLSAQAMVARRRLDVIGERGCNHVCTYCYHCDMGGDYLGKDAQGKDQILRPVSRWQSARYVVDMIKYARIRMGIDFVWFGEENFLSNRKRAYEICDLLEKENLVGQAVFRLEGNEAVIDHISGGVMWGCLGSAETADGPLYNRMRDCGCTYVDYGFESANNDRLKEIHKGVTVKQEQRAHDITLAAHLNPIETFMVGYPNETVQSIYDTTAFWVRNGILCTPFFITPYPRTRLFEKYKDKILKQFESFTGISYECSKHAEENRVVDIKESEAYEKFILALGDATDLVVNLSPFSDVELLGLRELMRLHDLTRIKEFALKKGTPIVETIATLAPPTPALKINEGISGNAI